MAKKTKKRTAMQMKEVAQIITDVISKHYDEMERAFDNIEEPFIEAFTAGAEPMIAELRAFVSNGSHYQTGETLDAFNPGMMFFDEKKGIYYFKFGFDLSAGGFPALILEYGDNGSPMRMPNKAYFFIHWATKNHADAVHRGVESELSDILKKIGV